MRGLPCVPVAAPRASAGRPQGGAPQRLCLVAHPELFFRTELEESVGRRTSLCCWEG